MEMTDFIQRTNVHNLISDLKKKCQNKEFSDVIDDNGNQYVDLVMEGGGVLGIALVGYIYVLEEMGIRFLRVGGTSAGSINALLLAGLGRPEQRKSEKMVERLANLNLAEFIDGDNDAKEFIKAVRQSASRFKLGLKAVQVLDNFEQDLGLNPGKTFYTWLAGILEEVGITSTQQLKQRMGQVAQSLRKRDGQPLTEEQKHAYLALVAADVSTETKVVFPDMAGLYWPDPDNVNPALYVRASMSVPFFFHPLCVQNLPQGEAARENWRKLANYEEIPATCTLVDGGIMSNFPIDLFHKSHRVPTAPTFGAKLGTDRRQANPVEKPTQLARAMFNSARHCLDYDFISRNPDYRKLVTCIDTGEHDWLNFEMTDEAKLDLFCRGAEAATNFLLKFDWKQYKQIRKELAEAFIAANNSET